MELEFAGEIIFWKGPAPFFFVPVPAELGQDIRAIASQVTYGWGVIPVRVELGASSWTTSLFPKDGSYLVPIRNSIRQTEGVAAGDIVALRLVVGER